MSRTTIQQLLAAGVHFGHLRRKWDPQMAPYIFMEKNGIHIIDLNKTIVKLEDASNALKGIAKSGKKVLFVGTKKQAKDIVAAKATGMNMPFVTERWPGGMLTNFVTIRRSVKKMSSIENMLKDGTANTMSKKERLVLGRTKAKLEKDFGSISDLNRLPAALFIIDIKREHIAVAEAKRLNIPTFGIVDTNSNPNEVDYAIPANDDAADSVSLILDVIAEAINEGLRERKAEKADENPIAKVQEEKKEDAGVAVTEETADSNIIAAAKDEKIDVTAEDESSDKPKDGKKKAVKAEATEE